MTIRARVNSREVSQAIGRLVNSRYRRAVPEALKRTSFEVMDAEKAHVQQQLKLTRRGKTLLTGKKSWFFRVRGQGSKAVSRIQPKRKANELLVQHQRGFSRKQLRRSHITVRVGGAGVLGRFGIGRGRRLYAIPVDARVSGASNRVAKRDTPDALLAPGGGGWLHKGPSKWVILARRGRGRQIKLMWALVPRPVNPPALRLYAVAAATAKRHFPRAAERALNRLGNPR